MQRLGKLESPVVEKTFLRKQCLQGARFSFTWGMINLVLAAVMYCEISYGPMFSILNSLQPLLRYIEWGLFAIFAINVVWDILTYFNWCFWTSTVEINPIQKKLMGIKQNESGFRNPIPKQPATPVTSNVEVPSYSPSSFTSARGAYVGMSTPLSTPHLTASPFSPSFSPSAYPLISPLGATPSPHRNPSPLGHRTPSPSPSGSSPGLGSSYLASGSYTGGVLETTPGPYGGKQNPSRSFGALGQNSPLSVTNTLSPLFREANGPETSGLRARRSTTAQSSPMRAEDCITDQKALNQFLAEQHDKEYRRQAASPEASPSNTSSFWNFNRSLTDYTPVLRKYQYQIACRSPQQAKAKDDDNDEPASYLAEEVWSIHNVHLDEVDKWIESLRKWLSSTILKSVLEEIDKVNDTLNRIGCQDMQIGEVGISTLKQLATNKCQYVPTLNGLVPFLEVCANQEYLISRIRALGSTGCMSEYKWNGGGMLKGKAWGEHLPTDAAILVHLLCSYMDARLPTHPKYPDGKTFTAQHFLKSPDKPDATKKDHLLLYQAKMNPPHFKVLLEDDVLNPPKGRNNLFHGILLFLHHIKVKKRGMLGRINLGMSGINILWVLDS